MSTARTRRWPARTAVVLAAAAAAGAAMPAAEARPPKGDTARVSEGPKGEQLDGPSHTLGLSADGRSALFTSTATNLLPEAGTPNLNEIYVRDLRNGHIERVSVADDGSTLNAMTFQASISADGRYVAFSTSATNVLPGQPKHYSDVFVRDRWTGRTELVTADGLPGTGDQSPFEATSPSISADGRYVAYVSNRGDLAPGAGAAGGTNNVYVTDRWTHTSRLVTVGADGAAADSNSFSPTIGADGSTVGFGSRAENLLPDAPAASASASASASAEAGSPGLARRPRYYPYYVWKADTGRISGASLDAAGQLNPVAYDARISPDGRYALYSLPTSPGNARTDVYLHELATGKLTKVNNGLPGTTANGDASGGAMTADGRWVYFDSDADNLVPDDTNHAYDVFRRDLWTGSVERVSLTRDGRQSTASSHGPYVDATGDTVIFDASDGDLVPGDTNILQDVFLRRP
ncbi:PD40 domain-containing protein [Streptomyces sp. FH025]|uniref:TolB family protein n=1 Tax=Streptomyces sp. FH025 TaxID=2815937 RepID=UPI001A9E2BFE|nr:PD40 domain-containing protein [Streptomyces sp. FH025]MBO1419484.1 PD40 domain-containing protein [Streptomyces sp. FH025]